MLEGERCDDRLHGKADRVERYRSREEPEPMARRLRLVPREEEEQGSEIHRGGEGLLALREVRNGLRLERMQSEEGRCGERDAVRMRELRSRERDPREGPGEDDRAEVDRKVRDVPPACLESHDCVIEREREDRRGTAGRQPLGRGVAERVDDERSARDLDVIEQEFSVDGWQVRDDGRAENERERPGVRHARGSALRVHGRRSIRNRRSNGPGLARRSASHSHPLHERDFRSPHHLRFRLMFRRAEGVLDKRPIVVSLFVEERGDFVTFH